MEDPIHAVGLSELLSDIGVPDDIDLEELEREMVNGKGNDVDNGAYDPMEEFRNNVENYGNISSDDDECSPTESGGPPLENYLTARNTIREQQPYTQPADIEFSRVTDEQEKSERINSIMENIDVEGFDEITAVSEIDDKERLLAGISELRDSLDDERVDISNIPIVDSDSSYRDVLTVHKTLRMKNDRLRYCSFAEDVILAGAYGLETLFDGKNEWFGRNPDLVGWSGTVKTKLKRMRYETSTFVHGIMSDYNISGGVRLMLELIPSMFLYSRRRKVTTSDQLNSDTSFKEATSKMNEV